MIERLKESGGWAYGFKVVGHITEEDVKAFEPQMQLAITDAASGHSALWSMRPS